MPEPPLVTVVTPVYNGEDDLAECVESVVRQTYRHWEYVIVDNCSTDRTPEIAEAFARSDSRVRYERHDVFVDVNASYNRALAAVRPESAYCKVVGADDWLYPECLERMVAVARAHPGVGLVSAYRLAETAVDLTGVPYRTASLPGREVLRRSLLEELSVIGSPTALLLRADLVRSRTPFYDGTFPRHADTEAAYWVLARSDYGQVHQVLTFRRSPATSQTAISRRVSSAFVERLRMLVRYGPGTLGEDEYRRQLRARLAAYAWWQLKQRAKPSRRSDAAFRAFHREAIAALAAEAPDDPDVRRTVALVRPLLGKA